MQWIKKGLLFCPDGKSTWNQRGYAHVVCADTSYEDKIRLYYSARDEKGRCQASFIDLDPDNLSNILYVHPEPILDLGAPGTFDDCGIMPTWFMQHGDEKWLYYIGWTVRNTIPYHNALGIASSTDGIHFTKNSRVLSSAPRLPNLTSTDPHVFLNMKENSKLGTLTVPIG